MGQRGFADPRNIFEQEMAASEQRDEAHLDDMGFPLDHPSDVLLNGPDGFRRRHDGIRVWGTGEVRGDRTRSKSSKGSENGQRITCSIRLQCPAKINLGFPTPGQA